MIYKSSWLLLASTAAPLVSAYPSYNTKVPNGERVPCPVGTQAGQGCRDDADEICFGLGHGTCAGGRGYGPSLVDGDVSSIGRSSNVGLPPFLNPFGEDLKDANFEWTTELCEADSDGDGFTNGQELGDPCCVWSYGARSGVAPYTAAFTPTHPGVDEASPPKSYVPPECGTEDTNPTGSDSQKSSVAGFNPGETQGSFEFRIKDYPIPRMTTTYVDFVFNLPQDLGEIVHIVYGEAIVDNPKHLHHFVVNGCSERVDEDKVGVPLDRPPQDCNIPVGGFSGWAPGVTMWDMPTDAGVPIGEKFGIVAVQLNVHYTDGDAPYLNGEQAIGTDGIRIFYTPDLRPKTVTISPVISVGFGPPTMVVEPGKERAFMTRTCTVESRCQDTDDESMNRVGSWMLDVSDLTCASGAEENFCALSDMFQMACPESCGFCEEGSPRSPGSYEAIAVYYHAHLLGREMYMTLIPKDDPDARIDLRSRDVWDYDDQTPYPLDEMVEIEVGDKIQTTCVFDSTGRTEPTRFDLSTYDEMCINSVTIIFDTPPIGEDDMFGGTSAASEIFLRGFRCEMSEAGDIWQGELGPDDDGRTIVDDHPLSEAECSFPTGVFIVDGIPTGQMRCNGTIVEPESEGTICQQEGTFFYSIAIAGHTCLGGKYDMKDSNDGTTEEQCTTEGGGEWKAYTCSDAEKFLKSDMNVDSEVKQYLREYWWEPKCCLGAEVTDDKDKGQGEDGDTTEGDEGADKKETEGTDTGPDTDAEGSDIDPDTNGVDAEEALKTDEAIVKSGAIPIVNGLALTVIAGLVLCVSTFALSAF